MTNQTAFETDSTAIKPGFHSTMDKLADVVVRYGKTTLTVVGHTDNVGANDYNQKLSERRAHSVARVPRVEARERHAPRARRQGRDRSRSRATPPRAAARRTAAWRSTSSPWYKDRAWRTRRRKPPRAWRRASPTTATPAFSLYLRRSFAKSMGYSGEMLARPGGRHRRLAQRLQQLPPPLPRADRGGEARRARRRRAADRVPDRVARRGVPQPDLDDVPQPDVDRRRGDDPRAADGRGGAGRRLRQDRAGAADGRGLGRRAGGAAARRADDADLVPRRAPRRLHRLPALLGDASRGQGRRGRRSRRSKATSPPRRAPAR